MWLKDNLPIEFDERTQQVEHADGLCELIINKPAVKDSGSYTCTATNSMGSQKVTHKVEFNPLTVGSSRRDSGLVPAETPAKRADSAAGAEAVADESGAEGGKGKRPPSGKPKAEAAPVVETSRRNVAPTIEELWKIARNKLSFITHLTNRVFPENSKIKLSCVVQGPDPNIRWLKDDNPIVYGARVKNLSREGLCILEIGSCTPEDSGVYTLVVRNPESSIQCTCSLQVYATSNSADFAPTFTRNLKSK